ncbi:hypothetical protein SteCoe_18431 [Stentor coeruleus]|uniref:Uncharacterized protein n=1 Tax=Stentor coeruleus TaxID=5963 RepID=A0A1R2BWG5_9CILI|nr:hypothetical protein SteCoe_18431 [Stentor coeruleus]
MERRKHLLKAKSKTPVRTYADFIGEDSKDLNEDYSRIGNSSVKLTDGTSLNESPERKEINQETWGSSEAETIASLKNSLQSKQQNIEDLLVKHDELNSTLITYKAQNNSLHKELNSCREKYYQLDVELYLLRENLENKEKEISQLEHELDMYKNTEKTQKQLKEENASLKEEIKNNKCIFEAKLKKSIQKNEELIKIINENNDCITSLKKKIAKFEQNEKLHDPDDFLIRKTAQSVDTKFKIEKLKIPRNYQSSLSPDRNLILTERTAKTESSLMNDLKLLLSVESPSKIMSSILHLKESHKNYKKYQNFYKQVSALVQECSPSGFFTSEPTPNQIWKWITRLLEEYMHLKQTIY